MVDWKRWAGLGAAVGYGTTSLLITFCNKAVFVYGFRFSNALTLSQMIVSIVVLETLRRMRLVPIPAPSARLIKAVLPMSFFFLLMVVSGLAALIYVNIPMYSALRRLTTFIVLLNQEWILGQPVPLNERMSVYMMVCGAIIASWGDLTFHPAGYVLIAVNCLVTATYLVFIPRTAKATKLDSIGLMYFNSLLSLPFITLIVIIFEGPALARFDRWPELLSDPFFIVNFILSSISALLLNYFIFLCSTLNSPLTTSVTGQLKTILQTLLGLVMFGDVEISFLLLEGLTVSTVASIWYAKEKYDQRMNGPSSSKSSSQLPSTTKNDLEKGVQSTARDRRV